MNNFKYFTLEDASNGNTESLYSAIQRVYLKSGNKEERQRDLRVTVNNLTGLSPVCQQNISLQLTDDDDPFFLYALLITEDDFKSLKSQQGLLVDFDHFPSQFVKLLEQCKSGSDSQGPRFLLMLDSQEDGDISRLTHLKIVETNHFKHLCHLDLKISSGSDAEIKKLMARQIKNLKDVVSLSQKELAHTSTRLNDCLKRLESKHMELEKLQVQWGEEKNDILTRSVVELNREKEKLASAQLEWQLQVEKSKQEIEMKHQTIKKSLESQIVQLSSQNHMLFEKNCQGESTKRERSSHLEVLEKELMASQLEITSLKKQNSKLDMDYHEKDKLANSLRTRLAVLEQEAKDTTILLGKQQELLRNANEQKGRLEEGLHEKENSLQRKQVSLKNLSDELMKANEILTKLQAELVAVKSKLKLRTNIALEQERLLNTKQQDLAAAENQVLRLGQKIQALEESEIKLQESLAAANEKVEAKDKQIRNDDNVIQWLNRQLASASGQGESRTPYPNFSSTPTPISTLAANGFYRQSVGAEAGRKTTTQPTTLQLAPAILSAAAKSKPPLQVRLPVKGVEATSSNLTSRAYAVPTHPKRISSQPVISSAYFPS